MPSIFDHVTLGVSDIAAARHFYTAVMAALGLPLLWENETMLTYGAGDEDFGLQLDTAEARHGTHVAFRASDRASVDRFHASALNAGGTDDGAHGKQHIADHRRHGSIQSQTSGPGVQCQRQILRPLARQQRLNQIRRHPGQADHLGDV
ncbi:MAG: VOC family protein, partial [Alphaproteobacteria bacterium]|nr:VOC family protein [Alphaproteobacteria bacterium]